MQASPSRWSLTFELSLLLVAALALALSTARAPSSAAQETGVIAGVVVNGTTGAPLADAQVTLSKFLDQTGANSEETVGRTDDDGAFVFNALDTSDGLAYAVSARHAGVIYGTSMLLLSQDPEQEVEVVVYDTTTDQSRLSVATRGVIVTSVDPDSGSLTVTDSYSFAIDGDFTVVEGPDGYSVRFPFPPNVAEITPRPGFDFSSARVEEDAVLATAPLRPDNQGAALDYLFLYDSSRLEFGLTAAYPTQAVQVLIPEGVADTEITLASTGAALLDGGVVQIGGRDYHLWTASALDAGETLPLTISGLPAPPSVNRLRTVEPALVAAAALLAAALLTAWIVRARGLAKPRPVVLAPAAAAPLDARRDALVRELRALEAERDAGALADAVYYTRRRAILEDLRRVSRQYRGLGDDE